MYSKNLYTWHHGVHSILLEYIQFIHMAPWCTQYSFGVHTIYTHGTMVYAVLFWSTYNLYTWYHGARSTLLEYIQLIHGKEMHVTILIPHWLIQGNQEKHNSLNTTGVCTRKTTSLYLQENFQISNVRLLRLRCAQPSHLFSSSDFVKTSSSNVRMGDLCLLRRVDSEKVFLGRVIQFSYPQGTKKQSTYVDMSIDSYKNIGVFANWFARVQRNDERDDLILFEPLDFVFTAG